MATSRKEGAAKSGSDTWTPATIMSINMRSQSAEVLVWSDAKPERQLNPRVTLAATEKVFARLNVSLNRLAWAPGSARRRKAPASAAGANLPRLPAPEWPSDVYLQQQRPARRRSRGFGTKSFGRGAVACLDDLDVIGEEQFWEEEWEEEEEMLDDAEGGAWEGEACERETEAVGEAEAEAAAEGQIVGSSIRSAHHVSHPSTLSFVPVHSRGFAYAALPL